MTPHEAYQIWRMGRFDDNPVPTHVTEAFYAGFAYGLQEGMTGGRDTRSQATIAALSGLLASSIEMHDPSQYAQAAINIGEEVAQELGDQGTASSPIIGIVKTLVQFSGMAEPHKNELLAQLDKLISDA